MSEINPVLEAVDDALDKVEDFVSAKMKGSVRNIGLSLIAALRGFLKVPDNYGGDAD